MPIRVKCPSCKKVLQAPSKYRGKKICCPGCKEPLIVPTLNTIDETALLALGTPEPPPPPIPEPTAPTDTVECPFCSEEIKPSARKCKHCGEFLDEDLRQEKSKESTANHQFNVHLNPDVRVPAAATTQYLPAPQATPSNGVAAVLSLVIPGAGQMYKGRVGSGLVWLIATIIGYAMMIIPGLILHLICIATAASEDDDDGRRGRWL